MGIGEFLKYVASEAAVIAQAPLLFFSAVVVVGLLAYVLAKWQYGAVISHRDATIANMREGTIASLEARIKLKDDQLANKLDSTPPNEAKAIIQALEERLNKISPRRLTPDQNQTLARAIELPKGTSHSVQIIYDAACPDCHAYAGDFVSVFRAHEWKAASGMVIGPGKAPPTGLALYVADPASPSEPEKMVKSALEQLGVKFDVFRGRPPGYDVSMMFTARRE